MRDKKIRTSADYPIFAFRLKQSEKEELRAKLEAAKFKLNKSLDNDHAIITMNEIILAAIKAGLPTLKQSDLRR